MSESYSVPFTHPVRLQIEGETVIGNLNGDGTFAWSVHRGLTSWNPNMRSAFQILDVKALATLCANFWFEHKVLPNPVPSPEPTEPTDEERVRTQRIDFLTWLEQNRFQLNLKLMREMGEQIWFRYPTNADLLFQVYYQKPHPFAPHDAGWCLRSNHHHMWGPFKDPDTLQLNLTNWLESIKPQGPQGAALKDVVPDLDLNAPIRGPQGIQGVQGPTELEMSLNMPSQLAIKRAQIRLNQFIEYRDAVRADPPPNFTSVDARIDHFLLGLRYLHFEKLVTEFMARVDKQHQVPNDWDSK